MWNSQALSLDLERLALETKSQLNSNTRVALLGVGSGLGGELAKRLCSEVKLAGWSRKNPMISNLDFHICDFSVRSQWERIIDEILVFQPERLIYLAGGGPFGKYHQKAWTAHEWAFQVNFLFPAFLAHSLLQKAEIQQMIFIGSAIAESAVDPNATSYSASKHALRGLITNLASEYKHVDIRLFSPGYMKTAMLPATSEPVKRGLAREPSQVAIEIINWMQVDVEATFKHMISQ